MSSPRGRSRASCSSSSASPKAAWTTSRTCLRRPATARTRSDPDSGIEPWNVSSRSGASWRAEMAWGGPVEPSVRRESWKKEIRRGPRPGDGGPYESTTAVRDRAIAMTFGTQVAFGIGFGVLIIGATVFYAQYSGALRWVLGVVLLAGVAYIVVRIVGARTRDPRPMEPTGRVER